MIGQTISHYRIVSQLGAGGMGVVYAAEDPRLGRTVALKFVPEDLARDTQSLERLRSEARTASALNHASICTIYDIGEHDGRPFIVMELLKGQTLRERLQSGPLKVHDLLDIGIQVSDALDCAHRQGIIHRDIKPANLFLVERGPVKILDFGLAKVLPQQSPSSTAALTTDRTAPGTTLGTVAYMSPEQVAGEELDGRTDIFSFGVALYECATARQPFTGKTSAVVLSAILNHPAVPPIVLNPDLPMRLQEVINACLEKNRELRYQDAAGLRADLKRIKRDIESGQSAIVNLPEILSAETVRVSTSSVSRPAYQRPAVPESARLDLPQRAQARGALPGVAIAVGGAVLVLTIAGAYTLWPRQSQPAAGTAADATGAAQLQSRLDLASASLTARNYRQALAQAEDVLRLAPDRAEAIRVRDEAQAMITRFDASIARANARLAAGDADGATAALEEARAIDPLSPVVSDVWTRLLGQFKSQAEAARARLEASTAPAQAAQSRTPPRPAAAAVPRAASQPPAAPSAPAPAAAPPSPSSPAAAAAPPVQTPSPAPPAATAAAPAVAAPPPVAAPVAPPEPAPRPAEAPATAAAPAAAEDDEAAIRRVVATYARAIETKDLALFRSVKPNLTAEEQRRLEEGFRAVAAQRVAVTITGIERRGQEALVRLRRRDMIDAGGRQQTVDTQQTMTLVHTGSNWIIRDIGR